MGSICTKHGQTRAASQTEHEFVATLEDSWADRLRSSSLAGTLTQLVNRFYRARFGDEPIHDADMTEIDSQLAALEVCLAQTTGETA